ncbi:MAG: 30S ribosomal protein S5 [Patescibacteria group bacterium]
MSDEIKQAAPEAAAPTSVGAPAPRGARPAFGAARGGRDQRGGAGARGGRGGRDNRRGGRGGDVPAEADYEEKNVEVARVTRVTKGGKRMRFRVLSVIGNRKGRTGFGLAKGVDVAAASNKASTQARKSLITVPLVNETIPHEVTAKFGAAVVLLKPAPKGSGVKAGGAVRIVLELAGVPNVVSKILGSSNKTNNVKATFAALRKLRLPAKSEKSEESAVAKK